MDEKENTAPLQLGHYGDTLGFSPFSKTDLKSRSRSIGPGDLPDTFNALQERRQSVFNAVKGILPNREDEERRAARRKSMANRRVSFAPEATLHTWDVIDHMRDHTTSTEDTQNARPNSGDDNMDPSSSPSSQLVSDDGEESASGEEEGDESELDEGDATGTAMSFVSEGDMTQNTVASGGSSTSSSLDRNLRLAAATAGTRGIEYDEFGEMSMEFANEEITNAFQPWVQTQADETDERRGSAAYDQENMNPFVNKPVFQHSEHEEVTMEITTAVGGVIPANIMSSPFNEVPMDMTQPIGSIKSQFQFSPSKRARTDDTPTAGPSPAKRARSRYSLASNQTAQWDATMDFTQALGGIRAASELSSDGNEELSMELTGVIGGISRQLDHTYRQALPEASSPFRVDAEDTITRLGQGLPSDDAQSPTPKAKDSSARRSSARLRRESMHEVHAEAVLESSPALRRSSRRQSGKSPSAEREAETTALISMSTPVQALDNMQLSSAKVRSPKSASNTPRSTGKSPKSASRSPRSATKSPRQVLAALPQIQLSAPPSTPPAPVLASKSITDGIKLMLTPRKEFLKPVTPKKATPSPVKRPRSAAKQAPRLPDILEDVVDDAAAAEKSGTRTSGIHLQSFLDQAGIKFMDLTTSKRRLTVATTPSRARQMRMAEDDDHEETSEITLEEAIVAAACVEPELELYKHACSELKRYIEEGKSDVKILEAETFRETPLLIQAYMAADADHRSAIDAQMRDAKTHARLKSKELWYGWRSNLVDDLMKAMQPTAEDLIADDEVLQDKESVLSNVLPRLQERRGILRNHVEELFAAVPRDEDKAELAQARGQLMSANAVLDQKRQLLLRLQTQMATIDAQHDELAAVKEEHLLTIQAADQIRAEKELASGDQAARLKNAVSSLESSYEWSVVSASARPPTVTMTYKSQLELFFHPLAFGRSETVAQNAPISLNYIAAASMSTTARFVLQLLKAHLQTMPQASTQINDMLALIANTWENALQLIETERQLSIEGPVKTAIVSDNCLAVKSSILLPAVKTKVCAAFNISVALETGSDVGLTTLKSVKVVYGEPYNEKNMSDFLNKQTDAGLESWSMAIKQLRHKLIERGPKSQPARV